MIEKVAIFLKQWSLVRAVMGCSGVNGLNFKSLQILTFSFLNVTDQQICSTPVYAHAPFIQEGLFLWNFFVDLSFEGYFLGGLVVDILKQDVTFLAQ